MLGYHHLGSNFSYGVIIVNKNRSRSSNRPVVAVRTKNCTEFLVFTHVVPNSPQPTNEGVGCLAILVFRSGEKFQRFHTDLKYYTFTEPS